jgi:4-amino-4-deoxy-L-arabinose transferase-like glycosyltransferase
VSATGRDSQAPRVSPATVAEWRRRQEASSEIVPSPDDDEQPVNGFRLSADGGAVSLVDEGKRANGFHASGDGGAVSLVDEGKRANGFRASGDGGAVSSLDRAEQGFAESQQAALNAMIRFARLEVPTEPIPVVKPDAPQPVRTASPGVDLSAIALARPAPAITEPSPVADQPRLPAHPITLPPDRTVLPDRMPSGVRQAREAESLTEELPAVILPPTLSSQPEPTASHPAPKRRGLAAEPWPLLCILAAQAVLSAALLRRNTAFADEALYLWCGHLEWAHLLHGTPIPPFATYFSGSPVIYPMIGALADSIGGLAAARALSGCFMLVATALLWSTTSRLYGRRSAYFAAGLWALLGPTLHVGAFATYDAMTLMLLAFATWCVVRGSQGNAGVQWAITAAFALALANATKYASALWDPVVVAVAVFTAWPLYGRRIAIRQGALVASYLAIVMVLLLALATAGNHNYIIGIDATTLVRQKGTTHPATVLHDSWSWTEILAVTALAGLAAIWRSQRDAKRRALAVTLVVAGLLAPLNQARLHTDVSLIKHTDYGAWFTAIVAGYLLSELMTGGWPRRALASVAATATIVATAVIGYPQAEGFYLGWPNTTDIMAIMRPLMRETNGPILFQNPALLEYYFKIGIGWKRITGQNSLRLPSGRTIDVAPVGSDGVAGPYLAFIATGYFKVIALNDYGNNPYDGPVIAMVESDHDYVMVGHTPWQDGNFMVWKYEPRRSP